MNGAEPRTVEIYQQQEDGSFVTYNAPNRGHHPWALEEGTDAVDIPIHGLENYGTPAGEYQFRLTVTDERGQWRQSLLHGPDPDRDLP